MQIKYNIEKLERIIRDLSVLTGISIAFLDADYNTLCESKSKTDFCCKIQTIPHNLSRCAYSDGYIFKKCRQTGAYESHICHAGLYDAAMPIMKNEAVAGYIIMGRIRSSASPLLCRYSDNGILDELYNQVPYFTDQQIASLKTLLPTILFESAIEFEFEQVIEEITAYIDNNFYESLSVNSICARFFISKNHLYRSFKNYHGTTVNEYITAVRIEKAKLLLTETAEPVYSVGEKIGIDNYTYFCKLFKKKVRMSPSEYRKANKPKAPLH